LLLWKELAEESKREFLENGLKTSLNKSISKFIVNSPREPSAAGLFGQDDRIYRIFIHPVHY